MLRLVWSFLLFFSFYNAKTARRPTYSLTDRPPSTPARHNNLRSFLVEKLISPFCLLSKINISNPSPLRCFLHSNSPLIHRPSPPRPHTHMHPLSSLCICFTCPSFCPSSSSLWGSARPPPRPPPPPPPPSCSSSYPSSTASPPPPQPQLHS